MSTPKSRNQETKELSNRKVLVIGLDGATWDLIKPWAEEGNLPAFKKLMDEGVYGNLKSTLPIHTIPAWNCMLTGKNPGKLGVFTFLQKDPDSHVFHPYFFINKPERNSIIDILSKNRKRVCSINLPTTHSTYKINGCMVGGWLYNSNKPFTYPEKLKSELDRITGGYEIDTYQNIDVPHLGGEEIENTEEFLKCLYRITEKRAKATQYLLNKYDWDFFMVVFTGPDRIQHKLWEDKNEIEKYYQYIDKIIAKLLDKIDDEVVTILVSDHGFGPQSRVFNINEWLIEKGLLKLQIDWRTKLRRTLGWLHLWHLGKRFLPSHLKNRIGAKIHAISFEKANIDWSKTKAYSYSRCGEIYINLKGRKKDEEYEELRNRVIKELKELKIAGKKIPINVFKKEEIYFGKYIDKAPDLIIQLDDNICGINTRIGYGSIFSNGKGGNHRIHGIFLAHGSGIKKGVEIQGTKIYDIAPTILYIMGVPIPKDMDGRVLKEIFEEDSELYKKSITYQEIDEKVRLKERIRELKTLREI